MKKKFFQTGFHLFLLTLLALITLQVHPVLASSLSKEKPKHFAKAYLKNKDTKEKFELPVEIVEHETATGGSTDYIVPLSISTLSESHYKYDPTGGAGAKLTVTQYYNEQWVPNHQVAIDRTNARWDKYDNTYTIFNAEIGSAVWASNPPLIDSRFLSIGTPSNGAIYVHTPPWAGQFVVVDDSAYQESIANSDIRRGSGTVYAFNLCVSQGGAAQLTCE